MFKQFIYEYLSGPLRSIKKLLLAIILFYLIFIIIWGVKNFNVNLLLVVIPSVLLFCFLAFIVFGLLTKVSGKLNDLHYEVSFNRYLLSGFNKYPITFFDGAAANPSLVLLLVKILQFCKPLSILEIGSGQTTKILSMYKVQNDNVNILTLEQDEYWVNQLKSEIKEYAETHEYLYLPMVETDISMQVGHAMQVRWFDIAERFDDAKFNFILIDGPNGSATYSRAGIVKYLLNIIADDFVLIFDDAERKGEIETVNLVANLLKKQKIEFTKYEVNGVKRQVVFASRKYSFLQYS